MMNLRFRKPTIDQLDLISSILGTIAGVAELLVATGKISNEDGQLVAGFALIAWGFFSNKAPRTPKIRQQQQQPYLRSERHELLVNELGE
ncbi:MULTISPECIES: hypothetical protein [unclassified Microcoleus]|uniref:hypothetical protein n=2 Tax=unclassified Microcoleus TaxID=2642155 RepID=UPI002FCF50E4